MDVVIPGHIEAALKEPSSGRVFTELVASKSLPKEEKSIFRLSTEGFTFLLAGTETTAVSAKPFIFPLQPISRFFILICFYPFPLELASSNKIIGHPHGRHISPPSQLCNLRPANGGPPRP